LREISDGANPTPTPIMSSGLKNKFILYQYH
jgi:hypothetical protein